MRNAFVFGLRWYASGVVTYELSQPNWVVVATGARWDDDTYKGPVRFEPSDVVQGVLLIRLVEDRRLEVEMFPGKTASQVAGFDANAVYYER